MIKGENSLSNFYRIYEIFIEFLELEIRVQKFEDTKKKFKKKKKNKFVTF